MEQEDGLTHDAGEGVLLGERGGTLCPPRPEPRSRAVGPGGSCRKNEGRAHRCCFPCSHSITISHLLTLLERTAKCRTALKETVSSNVLLPSGSRS